MFTGIVEEVGTVSSIVRGASSAVLTIAAARVLEGTRVGDSIATNGVCLTVTRIEGGAFCADVMHETLNRSSLGSLRAGSPVNLERAMPADGRFGGHLVSGHIDGTGKIVRITPDDNAVWYRIAAQPAILRYVVEKGSVAVDGISLTVARVDRDALEVSLIPHTRANTSLAAKATGDVVILECDIVGKYVEKLLGAGGTGAPPEIAPAGRGVVGMGVGGAGGSFDAGNSFGADADGELTLEFLAEHGF